MKIKYLIQPGLYLLVFVWLLPVRLPAKTHYLRVTEFSREADSLAGEIEHNFWRLFCEEVEKSEAVRITATRDQIGKLLEIDEEIDRVPDIFAQPDSTAKKIPPTCYLEGKLKRHQPAGFYLDIQIFEVGSGLQIAHEAGPIPLPKPYDWYQTRAGLRKIVLKLMTYLDPKAKKQRDWLGEPFDPAKINILVADFIDLNGLVDDAGKTWAARTEGKLKELTYQDQKLQEVVEIKRLFADSTGIVIRNEEKATETGEALNADVVIWGKNLCSGGSICYMAYANIRHQARTARSFEEGVLSQMQVLRADLPTLIGAETECLIQFIIGWTYLKDNRYTQYGCALHYLKLALAQASPENRRKMLIWAGLAAIYSGEYEIGLDWYQELEQLKQKDNDRALEYYQKAETIRIEVGDRAGLGTTYNNIGLIYSKKGEWDRALEYYQKAETIRIEVGDRAGLATTYNNIGGIYSNKGEWDRALEYYLKDEAISLEVGDRAGLATTYNNMAEITLSIHDLINENLARYQFAQILQAQRKYSRAVPHLERCVEIDRKLNHPDLQTDFWALIQMQARVFAFEGVKYPLLSNFLSQISPQQRASLFWGIEAWPQAAGYLRAYLVQAADTLSGAARAAIQNQLGICYIKQAKGDSARLYLQPALQAFQQLNDPEMVGTLLNNIGSAHKVRQSWPEALHWLRQSASHNRRVSGPSAPVLGYTYFHLGEVFLNTAHSDSAWHYAQKSLEIRRQTGNDEQVQESEALLERIKSKSKK